MGRALPMPKEGDTAHGCARWRGESGCRRACRLDRIGPVLVTAPSTKGGSGDGSGHPARRPRRAIHVQAEAHDRDENRAAEQHTDGGPAARPTVRAATPELHGYGGETTKYPTRGVLHGFCRSEGDLRRV